MLNSRLNCCCRAAGLSLLLALACPEVGHAQDMPLADNALTLGVSATARPNLFLQWEHNLNDRVSIVVGPAFRFGYSRDPSGQLVQPFVLMHLGARLYLTGHSLNGWFIEPFVQGTYLAQVTKVVGQPWSRNQNYAVGAGALVGYAALLRESVQLYAALGAKYEHYFGLAGSAKVDEVFTLLHIGVGPAF